MPSYQIQIKSNFKINENGFGSFAFQLFGTLSSTNEILFDKTDAFTQEDDLLTFTTNTAQDLGDILQVKVRNIFSGDGAFGTLELEYIQVDEDRFPVNTNLVNRTIGHRFLIFATKTEISSTLIYLPEIKHVYYLKIHTGLVELSDSSDGKESKICVKLWGENGNTILPEDDENFNKEDEKGWIALESAVFSSDALTNAFVVGDYGKISYCAVKFEPSPFPIIKTVPAEVGSGSFNKKFPENVHIKNIEIIKESFKINFPVDKTLTDPLGYKLYLNPTGPLERASDPHLEEIKKDTSTISVFKWITRNQNELKLLKRFLEEQRIVSASWGKAFLSSETDSSELDKSLDNLEISLDENELQLWENLKPRLGHMVSKRSFALDFVDERLKQHIDDVIFRVQAELDLIVSFFDFGNLDLSDPSAPPLVEEKHNNLLDFLTVFGAMATVASKIPVPQVAAAAKGIGAVLGFIGTLAKEDPKEDTFQQELYEAEKRGIEIHKAIQDDKNRMILVISDLTINVYQVFQRLELGRRISKIKALRSMGLLEEFSQIESILKENEIEGVPDALAPINANIKSLLRMIYDQFLVEKCHIMAKGIHMETEIEDETVDTQDLIIAQSNSTDTDYLFVSWTYLGILRNGLWVQQNWQIFIDPVISPTKLPPTIYKRILWLYDKDLISIFKLLKDKARIVPVLCELPKGLNGLEFEIKDNNFSRLDSGVSVDRAYMRPDKDLELTLLVKARSNSRFEKVIGAQKFERTIKSTKKSLLKFSKFRGMVREPFIIGIGITTKVRIQVTWISSDLPERWASIHINADFPSTAD